MRWGLCVCLMMAVNWSAPGLARTSDDHRETHECRLLGHEDNKIKVRLKDGKDKTFELAENVKVRIDGKEGRKAEMKALLKEDSKEGLRIRITVSRENENVVDKIEVLVNKKDFPKER